tara:strand:+ start:494 stop:1111 length:618 start_codon:yes stop_codon:yes gene_type:complete
MEKNKDGFFGDGVEFWIGRIVPFKEQRELVSGGSWGYRYKVRILGDYSNNDTVEDKDVYTAQVLLPPTSGTGAAGRTETIKLSQGDLVLGVFLGPDRTSPVILHSFVRTDQVKNGTGKFDPISAFTKEVPPGWMEKQEFSQTSLPNTPTLKEQANKGGGKGRKSPLGGLANLAGGLSNIPAVGAFGKLTSGSKAQTAIRVAKMFL